MFRSGDRRESSLEDSLGALNQPKDDNLSDDDNAAPDMQSEGELQEADKEEPLLLAIDDLEGRIVAALDEVKMHSGVRSSSAPGSPNVHEELATLLQPVMEISAHTSPSVARTYYRGVGAEGVEASCEIVYQRVVSDLVLPVILEMAQSDTIPSRRAASLAFFRGFWKECQKGGSWLDSTTTGQNAGPYGSGMVSHSQSSIATPAMRAQQKRRQITRLAREGEILRYWVQASIACTLPGAFTSDVAEDAVASRGVIAASASLRPSLKHIAQRIRDADDRGANKIFGPVMRMVEGVLKKLFLSTPSGSNTDGDSLRSACIKFLEIVCFCCSSKPQDASKKGRGNSTDDFSLEDLPAGHPIITREALESIAEYAFSTLRGLALLGGQVKIDVNLLSDMMLTTGGSGSPSDQVVSILKPAALAYLEMESALPPSDAEDSLDLNIDRGSIDFDFLLSQKSYALTVNAVSALAMNRPVFFKEGAVCLARRAADPPVYSDDGHLTKSAVLAIQSHVRASCLTLLRNALSVTTNSWQILHKTLKHCDMEIQADKALSMARQTTALKTAGRAARNRANMFYEWDTSAADQRVSKRQRETDDALAKMRAAKAARGLGHGIQLPTSMVDSIELVLANLTHLPKKRPSSSSKRKVPVTLDFVVDAVMTNGASLTQGGEGRWYSRDGGSAWSTHFDSEPRYQLSEKLLASTADEEAQETKPKLEGSAIEEQKKMYRSQSDTAAAEAVGRIVHFGCQSRNADLADFAHRIAARLAWSMKDVKPSPQLQPAYDMAAEAVNRAKKRLNDEDKANALDNLTSSFPLVSCCLALEATSSIAYGENHLETSGSRTSSSLSSCILNEAYAHSWISTDGEAQNATWLYDSSLDVFVGSVVHASERANDKPNDNDRKRVATQTASTMQQDLAVLPLLTPSSLSLTAAMCDIDDITKRAAEASRKSSQQNIATSAALNAAKQAAEKRATSSLLALRDAAFQRSNLETRKSAVACAVAIAAGRLPASAGCEDKALKLVMNVLFPKCESLAKNVVEAATSELQRASDFAIENFHKIQVANDASGKDHSSQHHQKGAFSPESEEERQAMDKVRKPAVLFMALCIRRPTIIKILFQLSSAERADVLSKTVRQNMSKLSRALGLKHGPGEIAIKVAELADEAELPLLFAFLDNLAPSGEKNLPSEEFIDACHQIQESKADEDGKKDARFLIPVVSAMKREDLVEKLPEFVVADDKIFLAALVRMGDRLGRQALLFREEPDAETPSLKGMTLCEQLVYLHKLDFAAAKLPQKRYLDAIRLCLDNDEIFNDRLIMSALDHMSGTFLTGAEKLPLAYMRTIILVCSKHETLHNWICHVLLPRLVEGKIYTDRRQWEGWMRCAKMLESTGDSSASSLEAINKLPPEQLEMYRSRYGSAS